MHPKTALPYMAVLALAVPGACSSQSIAEKQPINHPLRGVEAAPVPADLMRSLMTTRSKVLIPELTEVRLILRDDMKSGFTRPGSEVLFQVAEDVYGPGPVLVLTRGTPALGHVVKSDGHQSFGRAGHLYLTCDYILAQDKTRIPLRAVETKAQGKSNSGDAWLAGALGGLTGGSLSSAADAATRSWWPLGFLGPVVAVFIEGRNADLHPGHPFVVHTERDVATMAPLPSDPAQPEDPDTSRSHLSQKYQALQHYPTVRLKSGDTLLGVVEKDPDGKWATIYGPLQNMDRVLVADILSIH